MTQHKDPIYPCIINNQHKYTDKANPSTMEVDLRANVHSKIVTKKTNNPEYDGTVTSNKAFLHGTNKLGLYFCIAMMQFGMRSWRYMLPMCTDPISYS